MPLSRIASVIATLFICAVTSADAATAPRPATVKFLLLPQHQKTQIAAANIAAAGGRIVATYDSGYAVVVSEAARDAFLERMNASAVEARVLEETIYTPGRSINPLADDARTISPHPGLYVVQYVAPAMPIWQRVLADRNVTTVEELHEHAIVVVATPEQASELRREPWVQYVGTYEAEDKFAPFGPGEGLFNIQVADTPLSAASVAEIRTLVGGFLTESTFNHRLTARIRTSLVTAQSLLANRFVLGVETFVPVRPSDERQAMSVTGATNIFGTDTDTNGYRAWLSSHGITPNALTNSRIVVDVADTGVDYGCTSATRAHNDIEGRVVFNNGTGGASRTDRYGDFLGHGTIIAGIVGGNPVAGIDTAGAGTTGYGQLRGMRDKDSYGSFMHGMGIAPGIRIGNTVMMDPSQVGTPIDWARLAVTQYCNTPASPCAAVTSGCAATVQNFSNNEYEPDGANAGYYTTMSQQMDTVVRNADGANTPLAITVSAGNIGQDTSDGTTTVLGPATAKNVISVGAVETFRETLPAGHPCYNPTLPGNSNPTVRHLGGGYNVLAYASRRGTIDGRLKPDLIAPGTLVMGPHPARLGSAYCLTAGSGDVATSPEYHGSSGTSYAAPVAAGSIALLRYFYNTNDAFTPSPAMYKAMLVAGARSIKGGHDRYTATTITSWPNDQQGFGAITLEKLFSPYMARAWRDQSRILLQSESAYYTVNVADPAQPVKIVLTWTDAAGAVQKPNQAWIKALKNDLDVRATLATGTYYGNLFDSATGYSRLPGWCGRPSCPPPADTRNNVEVLNIDPALFSDPANRSFTVRVVAPGINAVGVPGASGGANNQDFALFVINGTLQDQ